MKNKLFQYIKENEISTRTSHEWWVNAELCVSYFNEHHGTDFDPFDMVTEFITEEL
tara:strand:- start:8580 stop:8747 length:168 start_codon:yes stop_codon:yes gene_type:complete